MYYLNSLQKKVYDDRYALKDMNGNQVENNIEETWNRIATAVALAEDEEERELYKIRFYNLLYDFKFLPGGRIISGAGVEKVTYYNCFVLPSPEDSRQGIMESITYMVEIMSRGGGVGIDLSTLRPQGSYVKGVNGRSSGVVAWAELYSQATGTICQGGSRRGALLLGLRVNHPDIENFITAKRDMTKLTNANLSVLITDDFMEAVEKDLMWDLVFDNKVFKTVKARDLWNLICVSAWESGEPGIIFIDQYNKRSNTWYFSEIVCCNPCGEQGLPAWGVCNLGHINLSKFVKDGKINYEELKQTIWYAVRFLDNIIDISPYFIKENEMIQKNERRIGLGTMGLADMLIKLGIRYGSKDAIALCDELYKFIAIEAYRASINLAAEKGAFPKFDFKKYFIENENTLAAKIYQLLSEDDKKRAEWNGIRNATLLTQAPTGSTSLLANTSSGIEPIFSFEFTRKDSLGERVIRHPLYEEWVNNNSNKPLPDYFVTAMDITVEEHIAMQSVIQKWVDSSISKTINAPNNHTVEEVKKAYMLAYKLGCKGITYYRDGSRNEQVLKGNDKNKRQKTRGYISPALSEAKGYRIKLATGCGNIWLMVFVDDDNNIIETFVNTGSKGGCTISTQAMSRLVSLALRGGISLSDIIDQLESAGTCPAYQFAKGSGKNLSEGRSCPSAIARALAKLQQKLSFNNYISDSITDNNDDKLLCPECNTKLCFSEGCQICVNCGFSRCK